MSDRAHNSCWCYPFSCNSRRRWTWDENDLPTKIIGISWKIHFRWYEQNLEIVGMRQTQVLWWLLVRYVHIVRLRLACTMHIVRILPTLLAFEFAADAISRSDELRHWCRLRWNMKQIVKRTCEQETIQWGNTRRSSMQTMQYRRGLKLRPLRHELTRLTHIKLHHIQKPYILVVIVMIVLSKLNPKKSNSNDHLLKSDSVIIYRKPNPTKFGEIRISVRFWKNQTWSFDFLLHFSTGDS